MAGWVYALVTPSMPGVVHLGATAHDPNERVNEANACKWHMPDYTVACARQVDDAFAAERRMHAAFSHRRLHPRREFFRATAEEATALIALAAGFGAEPPVAAPARPMHRDDKERLRAWVEANFARIPLREKDSGTKLEALFGAYTSAAPPVHSTLLGKILFAKMLVSIYAGVGPHRGSDGSRGIFLLR
jgi:hypothetical protein